MFAGFKYETLPLKDIALDEKNPRIVSQKPLKTQNEILAYFYENEDLEAFIKKIASEGKNPGAERPYVIKKGAGYIVIEGNTRIAAYKILTGLLTPPKEYAGSVPHISDTAKANLTTVDCSVAPDRDALMPIMASAHFGTGDKSRWGYLGSRKAVYDEWKAGKNLAKLSKLFKVSQGEIKELILEYQLYLKALSLSWTTAEKAALLKPNLAFNPPVRFLQTSGHKDKIGISYDTTNLKVVFESGADKKFKHLIKKLVITPSKGLGATATYAAVFEDYNDTTTATTKGAKKSGGAPSTAAHSAGTGASPSRSSSAAGGLSPASTKASPAKKGGLFSYPATVNNGLVKQLMTEAEDIRCHKLPASAAFLLRNIVEAILKHIIEDQKANKTGAKLDLEGCLNLCASAAVSLPATDKKVLGEFKKDHLLFLNLGTHGNIIPNEARVLQARDTIDQFVKKYA